jgi:hypothetical protein
MLGDLLHIPPYERASDGEVYAEATLTDIDTGRVIEHEMREQ